MERIDEPRVCLQRMSATLSEPIREPTYPVVSVSAVSVRVTDEGDNGLGAGRATTLDLHDEYNTNQMRRSLDREPKSAPNTFWKIGLTISSKLSQRISGRNEALAMHAPQ